MNSFLGSNTNISDISTETTLKQIESDLSNLTFSTDAAAMEERKDNSNPNQLIEGRTSTLGAAQTDAVWQIKYITTSGSQEHTSYANDSGLEEHKWSDRLTLAPSIPFDNSFSYQFSGLASSYGQVPNDASIDFANTDAFSFSFYFKTTNGSATIMQKSALSSGNNGYTVLLDGSARIDFQFRATGTGDRIYVRTDSLPPAPANLDNGSWHHCLITKASGSAAASTVSIYVNGNDETLNVISDTLVGATTNSSFLSVAANIAGSSRFQANLDEIAIWNVELNTTEVAEVYNSGSNAIDLQSGSGQISTNLISWWRMGDGTFSAAPTVPDEEGSNTMTLQETIPGSFETEVPP